LDECGELPCMRGGEVCHVLTKAINVSQYQISLRNLTPRCWF
jgi:hypothetical protein